MSKKFDFIFGKGGEHLMMQRTAAIAGIFIFIALVIAGCKVKTASQKQTTEVDPNVATEQVILQVILKVDGMTCDNCVSKVQSALMKVVGVQKADVSLEKGEAVVIYEQGKVIPSQLVDAVTKAGYRASVKG